VAPGGQDYGSVHGKRLFLEVYRYARQQGLQKENIVNGWKATGLWPVSVTKPLMSPLLVKKKTPGKENTPQSVFRTITAASATPAAYGIDEGVIFTPRKAREVGAQLKATVGRPTAQRLLFRKVEKSLDLKDFEITRLRQKIEALEAEVERLKPTKRKKVVLDPNVRFATIADIRKAQRDAGREIKEDSEASEGSKSDSEPEDCIVVGVGSRK